MSRSLVLLVLLAFAGCVEPEPGDAPPADGVASASSTTTSGSSAAEEVFQPIEAQNASVPLRSFNQTYDLTLSETNGAGRNNFGTNCLTLHGAPFQITNLTLRVTWTASGPLDQTLELTVLEFFGSFDHRVSGASPLTLSLDAPLPPADPGSGDRPDEFYALAVQLAEPGATFRLPATLEVAFQYEAEGDLEADLGGCALG